MLQFRFGPMALSDRYCMYYLGCPMWANDKWKGTLFEPTSRPTEFLAQYARYFNAVEGNTTFYADPKPDTILRWSRQVPAGFGFMLKVPQRLSHQAHPEFERELHSWLALLSPLQAVIKSIQLQLPASFGPSQLSNLPAFLQPITRLYPCVVEVRHPAFFDKGPAEQALHQLLRAWQCERMVFDARALFSVAPTSIALQDAQQKKPRLPVHVTALTDSPVVRFIGCEDHQINQRFYQPWLLKISQWVADGKTPSIFFHTPDNSQAPELCLAFAKDLHAHCGVGHPCLAPWPAQQATQQNLF